MKQMHTVRQISPRLKLDEIRAYTVDMLAGLSSLAEQSGDTELAHILAVTRQQVEAASHFRAVKN